MSTQSTPEKRAKRSTPEKRKARIDAVVREAGSAAPKGMHLIDSREPSASAKAFGRTLRGRARAALARNGQAAA